MLNPNLVVLKKLDKIMTNGSFIDECRTTDAEFLTNGILDCLAVLCFPKQEPTRPKPFRFVNYIVDKHEFLETVAIGWIKRG